MPTSDSSNATLPATVTVTGPSAVGVTTSVYTSGPTAVNVPGVPLASVTSDASKPVTSPPKVNVNVIVPAFVAVPSGVMARSTSAFR